MQHRVLEYYQVCSNEAPGLTLTSLTARSNLVPYAFVWEKVETMDFQKLLKVLRQGQIWSPMLLYGKTLKQWIFQKILKVSRCSQLNEYMKHYEYQMSRSFIDLVPNHSDSILFSFFSSFTADFNISSALRNDTGPMVL